MSVIIVRVCEGIGINWLTSGRHLGSSPCFVWDISILLNWKFTCLSLPMLGLEQASMQVNGSPFVACSFMKIFITSAIFRALTKSFTYIVSLVINSKRSLETSIIQRLDFFFHIQGFSLSACSGIVSQVGFFVKDAILCGVKFVINCHQSVFSVGCFVLVSILPFQSTIYSKYIFLYLSWSCLKWNLKWKSISCKAPCL